MRVNHAIKVLKCRVKYLERIVSGELKTPRDMNLMRAELSALQTAIIYMEAGRDAAKLATCAHVKPELPPNDWAPEETVDT